MLADKKTEETASASAIAIKLGNRQCKTSALSKRIRRKAAATANAISDNLKKKEEHQLNALPFSGQEFFKLFFFYCPFRIIADKHIDINISG
ncbi:hypothetical protein [Flavobacterium tistrianum]|uniref:hypothetical protein n=1 Tax=Flavobacterium tistrianum TaxID=1685414 RepID=UPI0013A6054C|nr:hypothetical protein [Flavobacterium tistrianum]KAF2342888.1 hypothetical protein DMB71_01430 [Flavobacterium tistrianum]